MLIAFSNDVPDSVQDADLDLYLASDLPDAAMSDLPMGHYAWFRGIVRDGSALAVGLSLTECAELYLRLRADDEVRNWAESLSTRLAALDEVLLAPKPG